MFLSNILFDLPPSSLYITGRFFICFFFVIAEEFLEYEREWGGSLWQSLLQVKHSLKLRWYFTKIVLTSSVLLKVVSSEN
jgi:hypothetical protein